MYKVSVINASCTGIQGVKYFKTKAEAKLFRDMIWNKYYQFTRLEELAGKEETQRKIWAFCVKGVNGITLVFENTGIAEEFFGIRPRALKEAFEISKKQEYHGATLFFEYAKPTVLSDVPEDVKNGMFVEKRKVVKA